MLTPNHKPSTFFSINHFMKKINSFKKAFFVLTLMMISALVFAQPVNLEGTVASGVLNNTQNMTDIGSFRQVRIQASWSCTATYLFNTSPGTYWYTMDRL